MEWFWLITAATLGGIANGLAGIAGGTVIIPMLIVLCPTFSTDTGVFQATTLALTCDVLSSAVTTSVYAKHGNIDLHRSWPMLICVLSTSILGSVAAWLLGGAILGILCLFLTLLCGVRYLVKPAQDKRAAEKALAAGTRAGNATECAGRPAEGAAGSAYPAPTGKSTLSARFRLWGKRIIRALAYTGTDTEWDAKARHIGIISGLIIGFGTGLAGTGGGMMIFLVLTILLGYKDKQAVGTATFMMTGTSLIAAAAHHLLDPTLFTQNGHMLFTCVMVATLASLISAQFANRVSDTLLDYITGTVLTVLAALMIMLRYL